MLRFSSPTSFKYNNTDKLPDNYFKDLTSLHNDTKLTSMGFHLTQILSIVSSAPKKLVLTKQKMDLTTLDATIKKRPKILTIHKIVSRITPTTWYFPNDTQIVKNYREFWKIFQVIVVISLLKNIWRRMKDLLKWIEIWI